MQPTAKGLWLVNFTNAFPAAVARSALPVAHALVQALGRALRHLRHDEPALARPLRKAAIALSHALVQCSLPASTAQTARPLSNAHAQAREVHRLLVLAEARRHLALAQSNGRKNISV